MITYIVSTRTFTNPSRLHSIDKECYETTTLSEAISVYEKEVETLSKTYTPIDELDYQPTDDELMKNGYYTQIISLEEREDDDPDIEIVQESEYFVK